MKREVFYELIFTLLIFSAVPGSVIAADDVSSNVLIDLKIGDWIVNPVEFTGSVEITYVGAPDTAIKINKVRILESDRLLFEKSVVKELIGAGNNYSSFKESSEGIFESPEDAIAAYEELERIVANSTHKEYLPIDPKKIFESEFIPGTRKNITFVIEFEYRGELYEVSGDYAIEIRPPHSRPPSPEIQSNVSEEGVSILAVHPAVNWYLGDLHVHSYPYTDCDVPTTNPDRTIPERKQKAITLDLDWLSITDHSYCFGPEIQHPFDPDPEVDWNNMRDEAIANTSPTFVLIPSEELSVKEKCPSSNDEEPFCLDAPAFTRGVGAHLGAHGINTYIGNEPGDWNSKRCPSSPLQDDAINNVNGQGGLSIINHPDPIPNPTTLAVMWDWESCFDENDCTTGETGIEVWNGPYDVGDARAIRIWNRELLEGEKIYAYAGSDTEGGLLGDAFVANGVYISGTFNQANLVQALKQGNSYITNDPALVLWASSSTSPFDYEDSMMGNTINAISGQPVTLKVYYDTNGKRGQVRLHKGVIGEDNEDLESGWPKLFYVPENDPEWNYWGEAHFNDPPTSDTYYRAEFIKVPGAENRAFTNPIWINVIADTTPPSTPTLISPSGTIGTTTPTFRWNAATDDLSGIKEYQIQVATNTNFLSPVIDNTLTSTSYTDPSPLGDTTYYWRVRARDKAGNWGDYSSPLTFTVETSTPLPDLTLTSSDIAWNPTTSQITATIHNTGDASASNVLVEFFNGAPANNDLIGSKTITSIAAGSSQDAVVTWNNAPEGAQTVYVVIDSAHLGSGAILESDEGNNIASKPVSVPAETTEVTAVTLFPEQPDIQSTTTITTTITNNGGTINNARLKVLWAGPDRAFSKLSQCTVDFSISSGESNIEKSCNWDFDENTGQIFIKAELWDRDTLVLVSALEKETYVYDRLYELRVWGLSTVTPSSPNAQIYFNKKSGEDRLKDQVFYFLFGKLEQQSGDPPGSGEYLIQDFGNWKSLGSKKFCDSRVRECEGTTNEIELPRSRFDNKPDGYYVFSVFEDTNNDQDFDPSAGERDGFSTTSGKVVSYLVNFHELNPAITNPANNSEVSGIVTVNASSFYSSVEDEDITKMVFQKYEGGSWTDLYTDNTPENGFSYTEDVTNVPDTTEKVIRSQAFAMDGSSATSPSITLIVRSDIKPDLVVYPSSISFNPSQPIEGDVVNISAQVFNIGSATAYDVKTRFYLGDPDAGGTQIGSEQNITSIDVGGNGIASVDWNTIGGSHDIYAVVDTMDQIPESNESNNNASKTIKVNILPTIPTSLTPTSGVYGGTNNVINIVCNGSTDSNGDDVYYNILGYYDSSWHDLELDGDGIYNWDVSPIASQTGVDLNCSATDLADSSAYFNPAGTLEIDNTPPDTTPPTITLSSPTNTTYTTSSVDLNYSVIDESGIDWVGYSLDGQDNVATTGELNTFSNSAGGDLGTEENISFNSTGSDTSVYLQIPKNSTVISGSMNVSGYKDIENIDEETSASGGAAAYDENWGTGVCVLEASPVTIYENFSISTLTWGAGSWTHKADRGTGDVDGSCWDYSTFSWAGLWTGENGIVTTPLPPGCFNDTIQIKTYVSEDWGEEQACYYESSITVSSYPTNPSLDLANDSTIDWNMTGELNSTNSLQSIDLNTTAINDYVSSHSADAEGFVLVPLSISSDTAGIVQLDSLSVKNYITLTSLSDGPHNVTVYANDTAGNMNSSTVWFTIDLPPQITISSPTNDTTIDTTPDLNATTDELSNVTYSWDNEGNISGCRNCTSYNTTYGENDGSDPNTVLLMHMNENYGTTAYDDASNNDGTLGNATAGTQPAWTTGKFGHALEFDGTSDFVNVSDSQSLDTNGAFTLSAWIYSTNSTKVQTIIRKIDTSPAWHGYHFDLLKGANSMRLRCMSHNTTNSWNWGNIKSDYPLTINQWHFVACVRDTDAGKMKLYVDGEPAATPATDNSVNKNIVNDAPLFIGTNGAKAYFNGTIDEVAIYDRALSASEIQELYSKTLSVDQHSVTAYANDTTGNLNSETRWFTVFLNISITSPPNATISDTTPDLDFTVNAPANTTYNWDNEGNISGCMNCGSFSTTYGESVPDADTALLLHFNENNGSVAHDDSAYENDGTITNAVYTAGKFAPALDFDGSGDYVEVQDAASLNFASGDSFTMMGWIKIPAAPLSKGKFVINTAAGSGENYEGYHCFIRKQDGTLRCMLHTNSSSGTLSVISTAPVNDSTWHHFAFVRDVSADEGYLYVDGAPNDSANDNTTPNDDPANAQNLFIGGAKNSGANFLNGTIDELSIIRRALNETEIADIYNKTLSTGQHSVAVYATDVEGSQDRTTRYFTIG